jgi:methionyl-tRNA formyltransferase
MSPIPRTILSGLWESGLSVFLLEDVADAGGIVFQLPLAIPSEADASRLFAAFAALHERAGQILATTLAGRALTARPQDLSASKVWRPLRTADGRIEFSRPGEEIVRLVRALTEPYPGAHFDYAGDTVTVQACTFIPASATALCGTIVAVDECGLPVIAVADGLIHVTSCTGGAPGGFHVGSKAN